MTKKLVLLLTTAAVALIPGATAMDPRPTTTQTFPVPDTSLVWDLVDNFTMQNGTPDVIGIVTASVSPYTSILGPYFWAILYCTVFVSLWIMQSNIAVPTVLGILFGAWMLAALPAAYVGPATIILALAIAGGLFYVYKQRVSR